MPTYSMSYIKPFFLLCLICLVVSGSLWLLMRPAVPSSFSALSEIPDSFMQEVTATKLNVQGAPHYFFTAQEVKHYPHGDTTLMTQPSFIFYPVNEPPWHVKSDSAKMIHGYEKAWLMGNVFAKQPPGAHSHDLTLLTDEMTLYPDKSLAETNRPVTVTQPDSVVHSIGMQIDMNTNSVKFLSHAHGVYSGSLR